MASVLYTLARGRPIKSGFAMTGELNLSGEVMPVGGIKEKVLGAHRAGLSTVILPASNEVDLEEVPLEVRTTSGTFACWRRPRLSQARSPDPGTVVISA